MYDDEESEASNDLAIWRIDTDGGRYRPGPAGPYGPLYRVVLVDYTEGQKIRIISAIRVLTHMGLTPAKAMVDSLPQPWVSTMTFQLARHLKRSLEAAGGMVSVEEIGG